MARRIVTIEINSNAIKLMEVTGKRVTRWASLSLEPTMVEEGVITDPTALSTTVKQFMGSSEIRADEVIASVSGLYSVSRILTVPNPPGGVITSETIQEAIRENIPLATDRLYLKWQSITTGEGWEQFLVIGVPRDVIDSEVRTLRAAGINPHLLDFATMALARAVNKEQALILNVEPSSFDITIVINSLPVIMRTIAWQGDKLTAEDKAEHLAVNLELTLGFHNSQNPNTPISPTIPLVITGQMSVEVDLIENLQARVRYAVEPLTPPLECPSHLPASQYAVNIGLALKDAELSEDVKEGDYEPPDINLLPDVYRPWRPSTKQVYSALAVIAAIVLLIPLFQLTSGAIAKTGSLQAKNNILTNEMHIRQLEIKNREPMQKAIEEYNTIVATGFSFAADLEVIHSEAERLGIKVQSISHEGKEITVTCQADSYTTFRNYLAALAESGNFTTPIPPPEGYPYTTSGIIKLEPKAAE